MAIFTITTRQSGLLSEGTAGLSFTISWTGDVATANPIEVSVVRDGSNPVEAGEVTAPTIEIAASSPTGDLVYVVTFPDDSVPEASESFSVSFALSTAATADGNDVFAPTSDSSFSFATADMRTPIDIGATSVAASGVANIITFGEVNHSSVDAAEENDAYVITRWQRGDLTISDSTVGASGMNLVLFDRGVEITSVVAAGVGGAIRLSTGALITVGSVAMAQFGYGGQNGLVPVAWADFLAAASSGLVVEYNARAPEAGIAGSAALMADNSATSIRTGHAFADRDTSIPTTPSNTEDVLVTGGETAIELYGLGGDDHYVITRHQRGNVTIVDGRGDNTIRFDDGAVINITNGVITVNSSSTVDIIGAGTFEYQLGDGAVMSFADFGVAVGTTDFTVEANNVNIVPAFTGSFSGSSVTDLPVGSTSTTVPMASGSFSLSIVDNSAITLMADSMAVVADADAMMAGASTTITIADVGAFEFIRTGNTVAWTFTLRADPLTADAIDQLGVGASTGTASVTLVATSGSATVSQEISVDIMGVNDAPTVTPTPPDGGISLAEDTLYELTSAIFGVNDIDTGDVMNIKIGDNGYEGSIVRGLTSQVTVSNGTTILVSDLDSTDAEEKYYFKPTKDFNGSVMINYTAVDAGGLESSAATLPITVTAVRDDVLESATSLSLNPSTLSGTEATLADSPAGGTLIGRLTFTDPDGYTGPYQFGVTGEGVTGAIIESTSNETHTIFEVRAEDLGESMVGYNLYFIPLPAGQLFDDTAGAAQYRGFSGAQNSYLLNISIVRIDDKGTPELDDDTLLTGEDVATSVANVTVQRGALFVDEDKDRDTGDNNHATGDSNLDTLQENAVLVDGKILVGYLNVQDTIPSGVTVEFSIIGTSTLNDDQSFRVVNDNGDYALEYVGNAPVKDFEGGDASYTVNITIEFTGTPTDGMTAPSTRTEAYRIIVADVQEAPELSDTTSTKSVAEDISDSTLVLSTALTVADFDAFGYTDSDGMGDGYSWASIQVKAVSSNSTGAFYVLADSSDTTGTAIAADTTTITRAQIESGLLVFRPTDNDVNDANNVTDGRLSNFAFTFVEETMTSGGVTTGTGLESGRATFHVRVNASDDPLRARSVATKPTLYVVTGDNVVYGSLDDGATFTPLSLLLSDYFEDIDTAGVKFRVPKVTEVGAASDVPTIFSATTDSSTERTTFVTTRDLLPVATAAYDIRLFAFPENSGLSDTTATQDFALTVFDNAAPTIMGAFAGSISDDGTLTTANLSNLMATGMIMSADDDNATASSRPNSTLQTAAGRLIKVGPDVSATNGTVLAVSTTQTVAGRVSAGDEIGQFTFVRDAGGGVTWTFALQDNDAEDFATVKALAAGSTLDVVTDISVSDGHSSPVVQTLNVTITGVDDLAVITAPTSTIAFVPVNLVGDVVIARGITFSDLDNTGALTATASTGFALNNGELSLLASAGARSNGDTLTATITTNEVASSAETTRTVDIQVRELTIGGTPSGLAVDEASTGATLGLVGISGITDYRNITFALAPNTGAIRNESFTLAPDRTLSLSIAFDFESSSNATREVHFLVTDSNGTTSNADDFTYTASYEFNVTDVDERSTDLTITPAVGAESQNEGTIGGTAVVLATITAIDPDDAATFAGLSDDDKPRIVGVMGVNGDTGSTVVVDANDYNAIFEVVDTGTNTRVYSLQLKANATLDHESIDSYTVTIDDNGNVTTPSVRFTLAVNDINEPPVRSAAALTDQSITAGAAATVIANVAQFFTDPDADDTMLTLTYTLKRFDDMAGMTENASSAGFSISAGGDLDVSSSVIAGTYYFKIEASDGSLSAETTVVTVTVNPAGAPAVVGEQGVTVGDRDGNTADNPTEIMISNTTSAGIIAIGIAGQPAVTVPAAGSTSTEIAGTYGSLFVTRSGTGNTQTLSYNYTTSTAALALGAATNENFVFTVQPTGASSSTTLAPIVVTIEARNDAPSSTDATITVNETADNTDVAVAFAPANFVYIDPEDNAVGNTNSVTLSLQSLSAGVRIFQRASGVDTAIALGSGTPIPVTYSNIADYYYVVTDAYTGSETLTYRFEDSGGAVSSGVNTLTFSGTAADDAPVSRSADASKMISGRTEEDVALVISFDNITNGLGYFDPDSPASSASITFSVLPDSSTAGTLVGVNSGSDVALAVNTAYNLSDLNAGLKFTPATNVSTGGSFTFKFTNSADSDTYIYNINVDAVADALVADDSTVTKDGENFVVSSGTIRLVVTEDTEFSYVLPSGLFTDPDGGTSITYVAEFVDDFDVVITTGVPDIDVDSGTRTLSFTANTDAEIAALSRTSDTEAIIRVTASKGDPALDATATLKFVAAAVNDAPVASAPVVAMAPEGSDVELTVADITSATSDEETSALVHIVLKTAVFTSATGERGLTGGTFQFRGDLADSATAVTSFSYAEIVGGAQTVLASDFGAGLVYTPANMDENGTVTLTYDAVYVADMSGVTGEKVENTLVFTLTPVADPLQLAVSNTNVVDLPVNAASLPLYTGSGGAVDGRIPLLTFLDLDVVSSSVSINDFMTNNAKFEVVSTTVAGSDRFALVFIANSEGATFPGNKNSTESVTVTVNQGGRMVTSPEITFTFGDEWHGTAGANTISIPAEAVSVLVIDGLAGDDTIDLGGGSRATAHTVKYVREKAGINGGDDTLTNFNAAATLDSLDLTPGDGVVAVYSDVSTVSIMPSVAASDMNAGEVSEVSGVLNGFKVQFSNSGVSVPGSITVDLATDMSALMLDVNLTQRSSVQTPAVSETGNTTSIYTLATTLSQQWFADGSASSATNDLLLLSGAVLRNLNVNAGGGDDLYVVTAATVDETAIVNIADSFVDNDVLRIDHGAILNNFSDDVAMSADSANPATPARLKFSFDGGSVDDGNSGRTPSDDARVVYVGDADSGNFGYQFGGSGLVFSKEQLLDTNAGSIGSIISDVVGDANQKLRVVDAQVASAPTSSSATISTRPDVEVATDLAAGGTDVNEHLVINGTAGDDVIAGGAGRDFIFGGKGDDTIDLSSGGDDIVAYRITDTTADDGADTITGFDMSNDVLLILNEDGATTTTLSGLLDSDKVKLGIVDNGSDRLQVTGFEIDFDYDVAGGSAFSADLTLDLVTAVDLAVLL